MKAGDLSSLLQLAVGLNLGFGAALTFLGSLRQETEKYQNAIDPYIQSSIARQEQEGNEYNQLLHELCEQYSVFHDKMWKIRRRTSFYDSVILHFLFGGLTLISLALLIVFTASTEQTTDFKYLPTSMWLPISSALNLIPIFLFFALSTIYGQYSLSIRPLIQSIFHTMRRLEAKSSKPFHMYAPSENSISTPR